MKEMIFETACALCAPSTEEESRILEMLCTAVKGSLAAKLRRDVAPSDCEAAFICACACMAAAAVEDIRAREEEIQSLRVGDVSVESAKPSGEKRAAALRHQADMLLAPYMAADFAFCGVRG